MNRVRLLCLSLVLLFLRPASAQDLPNTAIVPSTVYHVTDIDRVDTQTGNLSINIPLISIPQRGKLALSYSLVNNTSTWYSTTSCQPPDADGSTFCDNRRFPNDSGQIFVAADQGGTLDIENPVVWTPPLGESPQYELTVTAVDPRGGRHALYQDGSDLSRFRAVDGSGFMAYLQNPRWTSALNEESGTEDLYDRRGIRYSMSSPSSIAMIDPLGNTVSSDQQGNVTDSLGHSFVSPVTLGFGIYFPVSTTGGNGCPGRNDSLQLYVYNYTWSPPQSSQGTSSYRFCFAQIHVRTQFNGLAYAQRCGYQYNTTTCLDEVDADEQVLAAVVLPDGTAWQFFYDAADPNNIQSVGYGEVSQILYPTGGSINYTYTNQSACTAGTGDGLTRVVQTRTVNDNLGHSAIWTYQIGNYSPPYTGWTSILTGPSVQDPANPSSSHQNQSVFHYTLQPGGSNCSYAMTEQDDYEGNASGGTLLRQETVQYQYASSPTGVWDNPQTVAMYPVQRTVSIPGAGSYTTTTTRQGSYSAVNAYWGSNAQPPNVVWQQNPAVTLPLDPVTDTTQTDYGGTASIRTTHTDYMWGVDSTYLQANLLDTPESTTVSGALNSLQTTTCYDNTTLVAGCHDSTNTSPAGANGLVTKTMRGGVSTSTVWNSQGMPSSKTDGRGNATALGYDSTGAFVNSVTKGGITDSYTNDPVTGSVLSHTDPNGVVTNFQYSDPFYRLTSVKASVGIAQQENWKTFSYPDANTVQMAEDLNTVGDGSLTTTVKSDGLDRVISQTGPTGASVSTLYSPTGKIQAISNPFFAGDSPGYKSFLYDALGRTRYQCNQDNGQTDPTTCVPGSSYRSFSYSGNLTTETDERGNSWARTSDSLGRLTQVTEPTSAVSTYSYDVFGNLWGVQQAGLSGETARTARSFSYDSLSRLVMSSNPESGPICFGTSSGGQCTEAYDGNSNLLSRTDNRGAVSSYVYDAFDRVISKIASGPSLATISSCFVYDNSAAGNPTALPYSRNRLLAEWTQAASCDPSATAVPSTATTWKQILAYDSQGRITSQQQCAHAPCDQAGTPVSSVTGYSYNLAGNTLTSDNGMPSASPQFQQLSYGYQTNGLLSRLTQPGNASYGILDTPSYDVYGLTGYSLGLTSGLPPAVVESISHNALRGWTNAIKGSVPFLAVSLVAGVPVANTFPTVSAQADCNSACGAVVFQIDSNAGETATLSSIGLATLQIGYPLSVGNHILTATYQGGAGNGTSVTVPFTVQASTAPTTRIYASLAVSPIASTDNAVPLVALGCSTACGTVSIATSNGVVVQSVSVQADGSVSFAPIPASQLSGTTLTVSYSGDSTHAPAYTSIPFSISASPQPMALNLALSSSGSGGTSATASNLASNYNGSYIGYLTDGTGIAASGVTNGAGRVGCCSTTVLGWHVITAIAGNGNTLPTTARSAMYKLVDDSTLIPTSISSHLNTNPVQQGSTDFVLTTVVNCSSNCYGSVGLQVDGFQFAGGTPVPWSGGVYGYTLPTTNIGSYVISPGTHTLTVIYTGDSTHDKSSTSYTFEVTQ